MDTGKQVADSFHGRQKKWKKKEMEILPATGEKKYQIHSWIQEKKIKLNSVLEKKTAQR